MAGKACTDCEFFLRAGDGSTVPVSMNCTPRLSQTGKLMGMVVTGRPVGGLRRAYLGAAPDADDLKRTQGQLLHAEKMVSLGRLVAGVAHELNNPISFVLGNVLSLKRYASRLESYLSAVHASDAAEDDALQAMRQELRIDRILADMPHLIDGMIRRRRAHARHRRCPQAFFGRGQGDTRAGQFERGGRAFGALGGAERLRQLPCASTCRPTCVAAARPASAASGDEPGAERLRRHGPAKRSRA